jgi:hypothetical protein
MRMQDTKNRAPSSRVLQEVIRQAPAEYVTVGWLTSTLQRHSFGIIMLCLGLLATTPVGSSVPGFVLAIMAVQLIVGRTEPVFPRFIMTRRLPTTQLLRLGCRAIHVLKYLEKAVHPRWPLTFEVAKRAVGVIVLLMVLILLLTPMPLSNVAPAMVISMISLAYVEEDGLLLSAAFLAAIILIGIASAAVWGAIVGAIYHRLVFNGTATPSAAAYAQAPATPPRPALAYRRRLLRGIPSQAGTCAAVRNPPAP